MYPERANKILNRINELASFSEHENSVTRTYGTNAFVEGSAKLLAWMNAAGLQGRIDAAGNVRGRWESKNSSAKTFVIASHMDTVVNAGKFDGPLGVLMGLDLIEQLIDAKTEIPFHIELIAFCDEEGVRFHTTYLGSKVVAGSFDEHLLQKKDRAGISLNEAMHTMGGNANRLKEEAISAEDWLGYFEIHIEQGPVLYEKNIPVAFVTAIAGQKRMELIYKGVAGHAGTVPMDMRNDALCCAAECILAIEKFAMEHKQNIVATTGKSDIVNAASNVIPGKVVNSLDLRSPDDTVLCEAYDSIKKVCTDICVKRNIQFEWNLVQEAKPVACDAKMNQLLKQAITEAGYEAVELVSGAGHDAVPISQVSPVAMLFVRCFKGISHNPLEDVELKDIEAATKVSDNFIQQLIRNFN